MEEVIFTLKALPEVWHCTLCGRHGPKGEFQFPIRNEYPEAEGEPKVFIVDLCPNCRKSEGLELCNPKTCTCWTLGVEWKKVKVEKV